MSGGGPRFLTGCARRSPSKVSEDAGSTPATSTAVRFTTFALITGRAARPIVRPTPERSPSMARHSERSTEHSMHYQIQRDAACRAYAADRAKSRSAKELAAPFPIELPTNIASGSHAHARHACAEASTAVQPSLQNRMAANIRSTAGARVRCRPSLMVPSTWTSALDVIHGACARSGCHRKTTCRLT